MKDSFFGQRDWSRKICYGNSTKGVILFLQVVMHIYGNKFQEHCFNISTDMVFSAFHMLNYEEDICHEVEVIHVLHSTGNALIGARLEVEYSQVNLDGSTEYLGWIKGR